MPDLDLRFDPYTEQYSSTGLANVRSFAQGWAPRPPVTIEIGSNRGLFLRKLAQEHPERDFLGIELHQRPRAGLRRRPRLPHPVRAG
jgi:tRNA G46 methylase TrmB